METLYLFAWSTATVERFLTAASILLMFLVKCPMLLSIAFSVSERMEGAWMVVRNEIPTRLSASARLLPWVHLFSSVCVIKCFHTCNNISLYFLTTIKYSETKGRGHLEKRVWNFTHFLDTLFFLNDPSPCLNKTKIHNLNWSMNLSGGHSMFYWRQKSTEKLDTNWIQIENRLKENQTIRKYFVNRKLS